MHNSRHPLVAFATGLCTLFAAPKVLPAQTTFMVGPSGLPQIRDAIALAAPGDGIVVEPGTYAHFELSIGITIRAQQPGTVQIAFDAAFLPPGCSNDLTCLLDQGPTRLTLPPGQIAYLDGLDFVGNQFPTSLPGITIFHRVEATGGTVVAEHCTFATSGAVAIFARDATLVLLDCTATSTGTSSFTMPGLLATLSLVHALGSTFTGSQFLFGFAPGNPGILLSASELHGSGLTLTGQSAAPAGAPGGPALVLRELLGVQSRAWLDHSSLVAGPLACAVEAPGQQVELDACTLTQAASCPAAAPAQLLGVEQPAPLTLGATFTLDYLTEANGFVAVFAAPALAPLALPAFRQPLLLDTAASFVAGVALADATGSASASWSIPAVAALVDATFWFQGAAGFTFPLRLSPVTGGRLR